MSVSIADVRRWRSDTVREVFHVARGRSATMFAASRDLSTLSVFDTWEGVAATAAGHALAQTRQDLDAHGEEVLAVALAAGKAADGIDRVQQELRDLQNDAENAGFDIDPETGAIRPIPGSRHGREAAGALQTLSARLKAILAEANEIDEALALAINMADGDVPTGPPPRTPPRVEDGSPPLPPESAGDEDVKQWWDRLSDDQKAAAIRAHPDVIGNLDGVAVTDRSTANVDAVDRDIQTVQEAARRAGVTTDDVAAHPGAYGLNTGDISRYVNASKVRDGLRANAEATGAKTYLFVYQPDEFGGQGRAAVTIGDPDRAQDTAVVVPGTGHSVTEGWLSADDASNLYKEVVRADPDRSHSVIAWMGYDAPDSPTDLRIGTTDLARTGGAALAGDVNALGVTSEHGTHMTVLGHSYGSTTVADAAAGYGMRTDDVVLVGSPGTDLAHSAADFHLPRDGHLYVGAASGDPITHLGAIPQIGLPGSDTALALGNDPSMEGYGSTRFKAEVPGLAFDHSHYYDQGGESLYSMADIVAGNGDQLQEHGMTADHRHTLLADIVGTVLPGGSDPELYRPATTNNYH